MSFEERLDRIVEVLDHLAERQIRMEDQLESATARHNQEMASIRAELNRAVRLGVESIRRERVKRQELDEKITQLAAAQLITEEKLSRLIDSLRRPANGNH